MFHGRFLSQLQNTPRLEYTALAFFNYALKPKDGQMKKKLSFIVLMLFLVSVCAGTWFVLVAGPPSWIDPNVVGDDQVLVRTVMLGHTSTGGCAEIRQGIGVRYDVLTHPDGFVWSSGNSDPNAIDPNSWQYEWRPTVKGVFYARVKMTIAHPYEGGEAYYHLAFRVMDAIYPEPKWWHELIR